MKIDERVLVETGLALEFIFKELKLSEVLNKVQTAFSGKSALFGGTAINKLYLRSNARFSEDLDLHLFGLTPKQTLSVVESLGAEKVFGPKQMFKSFYRWNLAFSDEELGLKDSIINLDVNFSFEKPPSKIISRESSSFLTKYGFFVLPYPVLTYPAETLVAMKLLSLKSRSEGKDFYDLYWLAKTQKLAWGEVFMEAKKYEASFFEFEPKSRDLVGDVLNAVEETPEKQLKAFDSFILREFKPDWKILKKELVVILKQARGRII